MLVSVLDECAGPAHEEKCILFYCEDTGVGRCKHAFCSISMALVLVDVNMHSVRF